MNRDPEDDDEVELDVYDLPASRPRIPASAEVI